MDNNDIDWIWNPLISVGPFRFGAPAQPMIQQYNLELVELPGEVIDWYTYEIPCLESRVCVRDFVIDTVGCYDSLIYKGRNLLGISTDEAKAILGDDWIVDDEEIGGQTLIMYENLNLFLWVRDDTIVGATCGALIEDD
jgi:hypothetical protein